LTTITVLVCTLALLASLGLVALSTALHEAVERLGEAAESIHLGEEAQLGLLSYARAKDAVAKRELASGVRDRLTAAQDFVTSEREGRLLRAAAEAFEHYVDADTSAVAMDHRLALLDAAYGAIDTLVTVNVEQARLERERAGDWDRVADMGGAVLTVLLLTLTGCLLFWLRKRTFQPLFELAAAIERFTQGDRGERLPESGPQELRVITRRFNELASALEAQRKAQMTFLAGVAHDLRTPLSAMSLSLAAMTPDRALPPEPRIRRALEMLSRQLSRIERMLGDFMDMTKIEAGELQLEIQPHDARALVETTVRTFEAVSPRHRLVAELPEAALALGCDALRIEQVLGNLVSNAIKYSPAGGEVRVAARAEADHVAFEVRDHGVGMSAETLGTLFEPFRRGERAHGDIPGAGLGLFVVRRIVDAHAGTIAVTSTPGGGSTFRVRLPVRGASLPPSRADERYGTQAS
jgi:signal transduction histidine kinase